MIDNVQRLERRSFNEREQTRKKDNDRNGNANVANETRGSQATNEKFGALPPLAGSARLLERERVDIEKEFQQVAPVANDSFFEFLLIIRAWSLLFTALRKIGEKR